MDNKCKYFSAAPLFDAPRTETRRSERGNALIYVLIIVVLFAALNFILSRQQSTSEVSVLSEQQAKFYATQILNYAAQARQAINQMVMTGTNVDDLTFFQQGDADFDSEATYPNINKIYSPEGGGLVPAAIPQSAINDPGGTPLPGYYIGRFNNVEWTYSSADDLIFAAYKIKKEVCEEINRMIAGDSFVPPPQLNNTTAHYLIDNTNTAPSHLRSNGTGHTNGTGDLTEAACPNCDDKPALCVADSGNNSYAYYDIIVQQ